jgi:hypothetical protein
LIGLVGGNLGVSSVTQAGCVWESLGWDGNI